MDNNITRREALKRLGFVVARAGSIRVCINSKEHTIAYSRCVTYCVPHYPQSIRIPDELHRIDRFVENLKQEKI